MSKENRPAGIPGVLGAVISAKSPFDPAPPVPPPSDARGRIEITITPDLGAGHDASMIADGIRVLCADHNVTGRIIINLP